MGEFSLALDYVNKAFNIYTSATHSNHYRIRETTDVLLSIHTARAKHFVEAQVYDSALYDYDTLVKHQATVANWAGKGLCHYELGQYAEAIVAYQAAIALDSLATHDTLLHYLGLAYAKGWQFAKAWAALRAY